MKLPYRYRGVVYLLLLCAGLPLVAGRYALADTVGRWFDCRRLAATLEQMPAAEASSAIDVTDGREMVFSGLLLAQIEQAAGDAVVGGYIPSVSGQTDDLSLHTAQVSVTGSFTDLLRLVEHVEREILPCRIRSLGWQLVTDRNSRRLVLTLYIEQLVKNNNV